MFLNFKYITHIYDFGIRTVSERGCSIIASHIEGGWVSALFVMLRDGKQGGE